MIATKAAWKQLRNPSHLSTKLALDLVLAAVIGILAIILFTWLIVSQRFDALESREIQANISRLETLLSNQKQMVQAKTLDWSTWTDAYEYVANGNQAFIEANLNVPSIVNLDVSSISYVRFDGRLNKTLFVDLANEREDPAKTALLQTYLGSEQIVRRAMREERFQTFVRLNDKLLVLAFAHVLKNDGSGPPLGFAVIGREIEPRAITQQLQQPTTFDFNRLATPTHVDLLNNTAKIAVSISDITGNPFATIRFTMRRDIHTVGRNMLLIVGFGIAALLIAMVAVLNWRLKKAVVDPLVSIEEHVRRIGNTKELVFLPDEHRRDEIGSLRSGFNEMTGQLIKLRAELETQSFELGKNQTAIGVMHNVRNGLTPVFTILSRMHEQLHLAGQENVARAITELHDGQLPVDRREKLSGFLTAAMSQYEKQLGTCRTNAREAGRGLASVLEAIEHVQAEDRASPEISDCNITEVVASGLAVARHTSGLEIEVDYQADQSVQMVRANRVLLSQIVVNLLVNAVESIAATQREDGLIRIIQSVVDSPQGRVLRIAFEDNGEGCDPALAPRMFERGYSTRTGKTGGLGLHWCANTVNAMGGALALTSQGRGMGATAMLHLPLAEQRMA